MVALSARFEAFRESQLAQVIGSVGFLLATGI